MADDKRANDDGIIHYEGGIPVFNRRLDQLENEAAEAKKRDEKYKDDQIRLNRRLVWFTGLLAVVGIIGGTISCYQAHVAKINADAARDNANAAKGMVDEMKNTRTQSALDNAHAIAAQQQIAQSSLESSQQNFNTSSKRAERTFRDEQRAWVGVHASDLDYSGPGPVPHIGIQMRNTGKTPAFKVKQFVNDIITACCGPTFTYTTPKVVETPDKGTITPDAFISLGYHAEWLNSDNITSINGGRQTAIISGKVAYEDAYRRKHFTNYCFYYIVGLVGPGGTIFPRSAKFCPYGNDTDDDPEPPPEAGTMIEYP